MNQLLANVLPTQQTLEAELGEEFCIGLVISRRRARV